ncbi:MAG: hypothetical protein LLG13_10590 [Bacteroidales bacterium]|nr:hypothetical protein [Bacteroidales bacterium]
MDLSFFQNQNILNSGNRFFKDILGIDLAPATRSEINMHEFLKDFLADQALLDKVADARFIGLVNDLSIEGKDQSEDVDNSLQNTTEDYDMLLVFGMELKNGIIPTKTDISRLTRALNRRSFQRPVVLLLKYENKVSFSAAERGQYKKPGQKGEKVGRISILKDIHFFKVHAGHQRILLQLKADSSIKSFKTLYERWRQVFDLKILNEDFYKRISSWYGRAIKESKFPFRYYGTLPENKDKKENELQELANQVACIRLLTRIIFVWFLRHKRKGENEKLIPKKLFDKGYLDTILNYSDKYNSTYYKAILQNLFFATFNTGIDSEQRKVSSKTRDDHKMPRFRYQTFFFDHESAFKELFSDIPFLNGGLFESLDPEHSSFRIDSFSDPDPSHPFAKENDLVVPDHLFFGNEENEGLFSIFESYYFTIEENTPLDQEIALDPELLGKIFENLLAAYLPESKTSARKKTGSYYTPREIVNYMVDESLINYLYEKTNDNADQSDINVIEKLRVLFSYDSEENPFAEDEIFTNKLIKYLSEIKILDPACGSGAFPMGMLHQIVHALSKLDPGNKRWEHEQLELLLKPKMDDLMIAGKISSENARTEAIKLLNSEIEEIKETFRKNDPDYTRKLYLIQNCIFGVDIQPIAIHISKLRFFISLMVHQRIDENDRENNYGIKPLPNLETKFVAANTLRQLKAPTTRTNEVIDIENSLKDLRKSFFFTRNRREKLELEKEDEELRKKLQYILESLFDNDNRQYEAKIEDHQSKINLLKRALEKPATKTQQKTLINKDIKSLEKRINDLKKEILNHSQVNTLAGQIAYWNPYDQNSHAEWFDPEWMFGFDPQDGCFDIVIGNPPYGGFKIDENICEALCIESKDPYGAFIAHFLGSGGRKTPLKNGGILAYIVSDTFMTIRSHLPLRKQMMDNYVQKMIRVHHDTFGATVNTAVIICRRNEFPKDENGQIVRTFDNNHICQMVDLTNVSIHENYNRFIEILNLTLEQGKNGQVSTPEFAIYSYPQKLILSNSNLPFFVASPKLFALMNDGNDPDNKPVTELREIDGKQVQVRKILINDTEIEVVKLGDIAEVRQGLATGDNPSYLFQKPEARGNYRSIDDYRQYLLTEDDLNKIRNNEKLRLEIIESGISKDNPESKLYFDGRYIVPYDKGGESDAGEGWMPNYYVPTNYFIDWSEWAVKRMSTYTIEQRIVEKHEEKEIKDNYKATTCAVFRSPEKYFTPSISFSRTGVYSPSFRMGSISAFDTEGSMIFQTYFQQEELLGLLSSVFCRYQLKNFIGHTVHTQVDELKEFVLPIKMPGEIKSIVKTIISNQTLDNTYDYASNEQIRINKLVYETYGISVDDIAEIEYWFKRHYPKLSAAQKANLRKLGKSDDYMVLYGLK